MSENQPERKRGGLGPVRWIILIVAVCVFCYSGYRLFVIFSGYKAASDEYSSLADDFTSPVAANGKAAGEKGSAAAVSKGADAADANENGSSVKTAAVSDSSESEAVSSGSVADSAPLEAELTESKADLVIPEIPVIEKEEEHYLVEDAEPPLTVNFKQLQAINPDIVGWLYVDTQNNISYPILRGEDNEMYLHQTFRKQYLFAGSIFEDYHNNTDFADPNTVIYGHNMKDGSMFGTLKNMNDQEKYDANPYFWILTPEGNYRYHIFAIFTTGADSDTYTLYYQNGPEFLKWEEKMQSQSNVKNEVPLAKSDKAVILSTCTSDSSVRCVVIGKCVSSDRPQRKQAAALTTVKPEE